MKYEHVEDFEELALGLVHVLDERRIHYGIGALLKGPKQTGYEIFAILHGIEELARAIEDVRVEIIPRGWILKPGSRSWSGDGHV